MSELQHLLELQLEMHDGHLKFLAMNPIGMFDCTGYPLYNTVVHFGCFGPNIHT